MLPVTNFFLPGIVFLYQGQEIGMRDDPKQSIQGFVDKPTFAIYDRLIAEGKTDAEALEQINRESREHSRTPMQWDASAEAGFTTGTPWFPVNKNYTELNYEAEEKDPDSLLWFYRKMVAVRRREDLEETFLYGTLIPEYETVSGVLAYRRKDEKNNILILTTSLADGITLPFTDRSIVKRKRKYNRGDCMKKILKIFVCFIGIMISASTVSASKLEILSESEDYEKIVALADEIVSVTNGGPVEDPFEEGIRVSDIDFDNALKEYIDTPLLTSELLSVSEVESALEQSDYIWIIPIRAYGHLYEACAVRANGEDGQPIDQWHISGARGYELDDTPTYIEQLNISLAANPDIVWDNYKFRLVGGVDPIRFPVWITFTETQMEYLIPGREDAAACLTDSSEIAEDRLDGEEEFHAYSYAAVVAAVADSSYIETDDAQGGTNIVLDVANQPVKHQNKMLVIILGIGILAVGIIAGLAIKRKQRK